MRSDKLLTEPKHTDYKLQAVFLFLRLLQFLTVSMTVTGFIWASSDYLIATVLVGVPVTPLSVLLMLYGSVGSFIIEALIRLVQRKKS
jgi:hypothetical protein